MFGVYHTYQLSGYCARCVRNSGHGWSCRSGSQFSLANICISDSQCSPHTVLQEESSEDEAAQATQKRGIEPAPVEELDPTSLMSTQDASKQFRKAEKRKGER